MTTIPIQLKDAEVAKIDYLVKIGRYKNRNQAIKALIEESLTREDIDLMDSDPLIEEEKAGFFKFLDSRPDFNLTLKGKQSLADLISKDRDRFE